MNLKQIPNDVIAKVEDMIKDGCTYNQIKEATEISHGTIAKVKQGKITSNREIVDTVTTEEYNELKQLLISKEEEITELNKHIKQLNVYKLKYLEWLEKQKGLEKMLDELDVSTFEKNR